MPRTIISKAWLRIYCLPICYSVFIVSLALDWHVNEGRSFALAGTLVQLWLAPDVRRRLFNSTQLRLMLCFPLIAAAAWWLTPYGSSGLKTFDWITCLAIGYVAAASLGRKAMVLLWLLPVACLAATAVTALWAFSISPNPQSVLFSGIKLRMYLEHPNRYGLLTAVCAVIVIGILPLLTQRKRLLFSVLLAALTLLCWYSQSRAAVFSLAATMCISMLFFLKHAPKQGLLAFLIISCVFGAGIWLGGGRIVSTVTNGSLDFLLNGREEIWQAAWEIFQKSPLVGFGVDSFRQTLEAHLNLPENLSRFPELHAQNIFWNAHQIILGLLVEMGLLGLLLFLTLSARAIYSGIKKYPVALAPMLMLILYWCAGIGVYGFHRSWDAAIFFLAIGLIDGIMPEEQPRRLEAI